MVPQISQSYFKLRRGPASIVFNLFPERSIKRFRVPSIIQNDVSTFHENDLCSLLLYGDLHFNETLNRSILESNY